MEKRGTAFFPRLPADGSVSRDLSASVPFSYFIAPISLKYFAAPGWNGNGLFTAFCGVNWANPDPPALGANETGVIEQFGALVDEGHGKGQGGHGRRGRLPEGVPDRIGEPVGLPLEEAAGRVGRGDTRHRVREQRQQAPPQVAEIGIARESDHAAAAHPLRPQPGRQREARRRFGANPIPHKHFLYEVMRRGDEPRAYALLADQTPLAKVPKHWIRFLNRDTAFFLGPERIARYLDASVVYVAMKRVRRGYYDVHIDVIAEPPYDDDAGPAIAEAYARHLEATILASPADWLWIHNKWKYPKPADAARPPRRKRA